MKLKGEARLRIRDMQTQQLVSDTGWVSNVVVDAARLRTVNGLALASTLNIFIHESTAPGRVNRTMLPFTYADQTPAQVRTPDTTDLDINTSIATYTVQFPAPAVARSVNIVGLTANNSISTLNQELAGIIAYTSLTTTVVQGTAQTADVQYRITWSFT